MLLFPEDTNIEGLIIGGWIIHCGLILAQDRSGEGEWGCGAKGGVAERSNALTHLPL